MLNELFDPNPEKSPRWSPTTKLVVGLTLAAIVFSMFISFRAFLGPVLAAVIISYLVYPWAKRISHYIHIPWRLTVLLLYFCMLVGLLGVITWGGITLVEQIQNLINFLQKTVNDLPDLIARLTAQPQVIGPFILDWQRLDVVAIVNQALAIIQPLLSQAGTLVGTIASSAASIVGWSLFSIVLSYFIVSETQGSASRLMNLHIPGYRDDFRRMGRELSIIWNAFLRGQLILFTITAAIYMVTMTILGMRYNFGLALLAGLARFLPYIGPLISWSTDSIVAYSQGYTVFGLPTEYYMLTVLITAWVTDAIIDNLISPRIFSNALKIHPAAVMVCALLAFNLMGILGIVLAAPALATLKLVFDYTVRKLLDMDPWADFERTSPPIPLYQVILQYSFRGWEFARVLFFRVRQWINQLHKPGSDRDITPSSPKS
jgi:predicted PurR-regulated permease PerM